MGNIVLVAIQQLGPSLLPMFLSSKAPLLKQRSTCAKGCDPIDINALQASNEMDMSTPRGLQNKVFIDLSVI